MTLALASSLTFYLSFSSDLLIYLAFYPFFFTENSSYAIWFILFSMRIIILWTCLMRSISSISSPYLSFSTWKIDEKVPQVIVWFFLFLFDGLVKPHQVCWVVSSFLTHHDKDWECKVLLTFKLFWKFHNLKEIHVIWTQCCFHQETQKHKLS